jgi:transposase
MTKHATPETKRLIVLMSETLSTKEISQATHLSGRTVRRILSAHRQGIPFEKVGNRGASRKLNNWDLDVSTINHRHHLISVLNLSSS